MAKKNYKDKLVKRENITEEMKLIEGSDTDYITPSGQVYKDYGDGFFPKKTLLIKLMAIYIVELQCQMAITNNFEHTFW